MSRSRSNEPVSITNPQLIASSHAVSTSPVADVASSAAEIVNLNSALKRMELEMQVLKRSWKAPTLDSSPERFLDDSPYERKRAKRTISRSPTPSRAHSPIHGKEKEETAMDILLKMQEQISSLVGVLRKDLPRRKNDFLPVKRSRPTGVPDSRLISSTPHMSTERNKERRMKTHRLGTPHTDNDEECPSRTEPPRRSAPELEDSDGKKCPTRTAPTRHHSPDSDSPDRRICPMRTTMSKRLVPIADKLDKADSLDWTKRRAQATLSGRQAPEADKLDRQKCRTALTPAKHQVPYVDSSDRRHGPRRTDTSERIEQTRLSAMVKHQAPRFSSKESYGEIYQEASLHDLDQERISLDRDKRCRTGGRRPVHDMSVSGGNLPQAQLSPEKNAIRRTGGRHSCQDLDDDQVFSQDRHSPDRDARCRTGGCRPCREGADSAKSPSPCEKRRSPSANIDSPGELALEDVSDTEDQKGAGLSDYKALAALLLQEFGNSLSPAAPPSPRSLFTSAKTSKSSSFLKMRPTISMKKALQSFGNWLNSKKELVRDISHSLTEKATHDLLVQSTKRPRTAVPATKGETQIPKPPFRGSSSSRSSFKERGAESRDSGGSVKKVPFFRATKLTLIAPYWPSRDWFTEMWYHEQEKELSRQELEAAIRTVKEEEKLIIGADVNGRVGKRRDGIRRYTKARGLELEIKTGIIY
ncbi:uncharacterized protein LOC135215806 [Macrobrachium nipponense]|uniref:uncharacterized protein LOC135215806 n=1 Tax=Macrobrachium nipponense TaxID=159736 RepID=UPI0030C7C669